MAKRKVTDASSGASAPSSGRKLRRTRVNVQSGATAEKSAYFEREHADSAYCQEDERPTTSEQPCTPRTSARKLASLKSSSMYSVAACGGPGAADCASSLPAEVPGSSTGPFKFTADNARTPRVALCDLGDDVVRLAGAKSPATCSIRIEAEGNARGSKFTVAQSGMPTDKGAAATVSSRSLRRTKTSENAASLRKRSSKVVDDSILPTTNNTANPTDDYINGNLSSVDVGSGTIGEESEKSKKSKKLKGNTRGRRPAVSSLPTAAIKRETGKVKYMKQPTKQLEPTASSYLQSGDSGSDDASNDEWEEVEELMGEDQMIKSQLPSKPVEVLLDVPDIPGLSKRKKKTFDVHAYLRKKWKKFKKEQHESIHKVHLLCYLSYGIQLNKICNHPLLQSAALSICTREGILNGDLTVSTLASRVHWFNLRVSKSAATTEETCASIEHLEIELMDDMSKLISRTSAYHALIFLLLLRACGVAARLVLAVHPIPWKISDLKKECVRKSPACQQTNALSDVRPTVQEGKPGRGKGKKGCAATSAYNASSSSKASKEARAKRPKMCSKDPDGGHRSRELRRSCAAVKSYREKAGQLSDSDDEDKAAGVSLARRSTAGRKVAEHEEESDADFTSKPGDLTSCKALKKRHASALGDESIQLWLEVYVDKPGKWICLDVADEVLDTATDFEARSRRPFTYVISYDNDGCIKDVTQRYASMWMSATQKLRVDQEWWSETLAAYRTCDLARDQAEDAQMLSLLEKRPFPTSVAEFKGHPLYALKRHLLKFEAIYPESAIPLGYIKGEAIYARECVHTLHSRETWLKHAKSIRIGEKPYKMVKPRPKMNKPDDNKGEATLGVFGSWQVADYQPPVATGGKVPRNEYGNVELFKPCMIPVGCVHLPIPGLHRVAKKLNIDVAPAMVGWEGYCGYSVPQFDGWIVCEEFKDILLAAWEEYEAEERRKQTEKKEKRVIGNWTLLVRGLLIKEKLKSRFNLTENKETSSTEGEKADDTHKAWPQNMKTSTKDSAIGSSAALFPFEQM